MALTQATEDNVDRLMTYLEQSRKIAAQLKDTLKRERDEGNKLKIKCEDMQNEVKNSKVELQTLQASKMTLEVAVEKNAQNSLEKIRRLHQEYQVLKTENDDLKTTYETLSAEKDQL